MALIAYIQYNTKPPSSYLSCAMKKFTDTQSNSDQGHQFFQIVISQLQECSPRDLILFEASRYGGVKSSIQQILSEILDVKLGNRTTFCHVSLVEYFAFSHSVHAYAQNRVGGASKSTNGRGAWVEHGDLHLERNVYVDVATCRWAAAVWQFVQVSQTHRIGPDYLSTLHVVRAVCTCFFEVLLRIKHGHWLYQASMEVLDSPPMKLSVRGRRIRHRRRRIEVVKIYKTHEADDCKCSVLHSSGEPILLLDVQTQSCHLKFRLRTTATIHLVGRFTCASYPYPYQIKWRMGRMRYKLRVNNLSLISSIIKLNRQFNIRHHIQ